MKSFLCVLKKLAIFWVLYINKTEKHQQMSLLTKSKNRIPPFVRKKVTMIHVVTGSWFVGILLKLSFFS